MARTTMTPAIAATMTAPINQRMLEGMGREVVFEGMCPCLPVSARQKPIAEARAIARIPVWIPSGSTSTWRRWLGTPSRAARRLQVDRLQVQLTQLRERRLGDREILDRQAGGVEERNVARAATAVGLAD